MQICLFFRHGLAIFLVLFSGIIFQLAQAASPVQQIPENFYLVEAPAPFARGELTHSISAFGESWNLVLNESDRVTRYLSIEQRKSIQQSGARFFHGHIEGKTQSWVRLSVVGGNWSGGFHDGSELYMVESSHTILEDSPTRADDETFMVIFRVSDLADPIHIDDGGVPVPDHDHHRHTINDQDLSLSIDSFLNRSGEVTQDIPVTIVTDTEFNARHDGNEAAVVASRVNFVDGWYAAQLGVGMVLFHLEILADNGPLATTDSDGLLTAFRTFVQETESIPFEGLAHLFTGKDIDQGNSGLAAFGPNLLCNEAFGYGWNQNLGSDTLSALVFAHEVGHNLHAPHDGEDACADEDFRGIMTAVLGTNTPQEFSDCSVEQMTPNIAAGQSCLVSRVSFTVDTNVSGPGSIDPTSAVVGSGQAISFTLTPGIGASIASVSGCGGSLSGSTFTTGDVTQDCTIDATFQDDPNPVAILNPTTVDATLGSGAGTSQALTLSNQDGAAALNWTLQASNLLSEGFESVADLTANGWMLENRSDPVGDNGWMQGTSFGSHQGPDNSAIGANFTSTGVTGTISNWLILPEMALYAGTELRFFTRTQEDSDFPDRLEVRLSTSGNETDLGASGSGVGVFDTLLTSINPDLRRGGYPVDWQEFTVQAGINSPARGRLAFRYFVTEAGSSAPNGNEIGIDTVSVSLGVNDCDNIDNVPWLSINSSSGTVDDGASTSLELDFDSAGLNDGQFSAKLCFASNDPFNPVLELPVSMTVGDVGSFRLRVNRSGTGSGEVQSSPAGIDCGNNCEADFAAGTEVTLTTSASLGSHFTGWSGACSGTDTCRVTMDQARSVSAEFSLVGMIFRDRFEAD